LKVNLCLQSPITGALILTIAIFIRARCTDTWQCTAKLTRQSQVNSLRAKNYYRKGNKKIDALVEKGKLLAVEVKEKVDESDARRLYTLSKQVGAEERLIVSWSQRGKVNGVQVIPAYALEWILGIDSA
jgi:hypothetical protein